MPARHKSDQWLHMFETAMQNAPDAVFITDNTMDEDGPRVLFANDAYLKLSGYRRPELVGSTQKLHHGPRTDTEALARIRTAQETGTPIAEDLLQYKSDSSTYWLGLSMFPLRDAAGHNAYFFGIGRDITQRKRFENEKKAAEQLLSAVFTGVDVGVLVLDEVGCIELANPAASRLVQLRIGDMIGRSLESFLDRSTPSVPIAPAAALAAHGTSQQHIRWTNPGGVSFQLQMGSTTVRHPDGRRFRVLTLQGEGLAKTGSPQSEFERVIGERPGTPPYPQLLIAGRLQLVGLDEIRSAFGASWPQVSERAHQIASGVIRQHLAADDVFAPAAQDSYVLYFGSLREDEAERQASLIAQEVRLALLSEFREPAFGKVIAHAGTIELHEEELQNSVSVVELVSAKLVKARTDLEQQARQAVRQAVKDESVDFHRVITHQGRQSPLWLVQFPPRVQRLIERSRHILPNQPEAALEVDAYLLGKAAERIFASADDESAPMLIVPVDWASLSQRRENAQYLSLCRELGEPVRRRLIFEITNLTPDLGQTRLAETAGRLRQFGRGVAVELGSLDRNVLHLSEYRVDLLTLDERLIHPERESDRMHLARLQKGLVLWKSRLLVKNVQHASHCRVLAKLGVELMTGASFVARQKEAAPTPPPAAPSRVIRARAPVHDRVVVPVR